MDVIIYKHFTKCYKHGQIKDDKVGMACALMVRTQVQNFGQKT
jgi:hypothetical protein